MPNYTFEDTETGEQFVEFMPMAEVISSRVTIVPINDWRNGW